MSWRRHFVPVASATGKRIAKVSAFDKGAIELEIYLDIGQEFQQEESWHDRCGDEWLAGAAPSLRWLDDARLEINVTTCMSTGQARRLSILRTYTFVLDDGFWRTESLSTKAVSSAS